jgi:uncharacterized membrane protein YqaE (UPF0057 family)
MKTKQILIVFFAILFIQSCTIEKRRYTDGYHVEWSHRHNRHESKTDTEVADLKKEAAERELSVVVQSENEVLTSEVTSKVEPTPTVTSAKVQPKATIRKEAEKSTVSLRHPIVRHTPAFKSNEGSVSINEEFQNSEEELLLIILAIFIPPLAVFLHEGSWNTTCWINLILTLLFWLPGIIHAFIVILR